MNLIQRKNTAGQIFIPPPPINSALALQFSDSKQTGHRDFFVIQIAHTRVSRKESN